MNVCKFKRGLAFRNDYISEKDFEVKIGDRICQGIFSKYLVTSDDKCETKRTGGIGSTNKEGK